MIGSGDPYSSAGAKAFELAAIDSKMDICAKATYQPGSTNMEAPIKEITDNNCCLVTVVFAQTQDLASLLLEAHKQNYAGEWVMGKNIMGSFDGVLKDLKNSLDGPSIQKVLRGKFYALQNACILDPHPKMLWALECAACTIMRHSHFIASPSSLTLHCFTVVTHTSLFNWI